MRFSYKKIAVVGSVVLFMGVGMGAVFFFATQEPADTTEVMDTALPFDSDARDIATREPASEQAERPAASGLPNTVLLQKIATSPVAGFTTVAKAKRDAVRFVERESGHVFEVDVETGASKRLSNTTIPRVLQTHWLSEDSLIIRYIDASGSRAETFLGSIKQGTSTEDGFLTGAFLPENIESLAVSPDGNQFFYTISGEGGFISSASGLNIRALPSVSLADIQATWHSPETISFVSRPSASAFGYLYTVNVSNNVLSRVLGRVVGLTALFNKNGERVLYSESTEVGPRLLLFDTRTDSSSELPLQTLSEKCVWSDSGTAVAYCGVPARIKTGRYPDDWYQGRVSFSDNLWSIDTEDGTTKLLATPVDRAREELDIINPRLTTNETHLVFMNKRDGSLWILKLPEASAPVEATAI